MISIEVEAAVERLLRERGLKELPGEKLGDFVARGLDITAAQANSFLAALNERKTIDDALGGEPAFGRAYLVAIFSPPRIEL